MYTKTEVRDLWTKYGCEKLFLHDNLVDTLTKQTKFWCLFILKNSHVTEVNKDNKIVELGWYGLEDKLYSIA